MSRVNSLCILSTEDTNSQHVWNYTVRSFSPGEIYILGDNEKWMEAKPLRNAKAISSAEELPDLPLVLFQPDNAEFMPGTEPINFESVPESCIFMFGSDDARFEPKHFGTRSPDYRFFIPTDTDDELFAAVAYAIAAWKWQHG